MADLRAACGALEAKHGLIKKLYRGHLAVSGKVTVTGLDAKTTFVAAWYDDATGASIGATSEHQGAAVEIQIPKFSRHALLTLLPK